MEALRQLGIDLTAQLDLETLLQSIVSQAIKLLGGNRRRPVSLPTESATYWSGTLASAPECRQSAAHCGEARGLCGKVWQTGEPLIVNDYRNWSGRAAHFDDLPNVASVGVMVQWADHLLGVLNIVAAVPHTFAPTDAELLNLFATQAATAIHNAQFFEQAGRRGDRLAVVNRIAHAVGMTLHLDDLLASVYHELAPVFDPDAMFVALYDQDANELDFRLQVDEGVRQAPARQPLTEGLTSRVIGALKPLLIRDFGQERRTFRRRRCGGR